MAMRGGVRIDDDARTESRDQPTADVARERGELMGLAEAKDRLDRATRAARAQLDVLEQRARRIGNDLEPDSPRQRRRHYALLGLVAISIVLGASALWRTV